MNFAPGVFQPIFRWVTTILDEAFAWYLYHHVIDGYNFLMQNYDSGDRVCLFGSSNPYCGSDGWLTNVILLPGFSRGAYTARALAGMLYKV